MRMNIKILAKQHRFSSKIAQTHANRKEATVLYQGNTEAVIKGKCKGKTGKNKLLFNFNLKKTKKKTF